MKFFKQCFAPALASYGVTAYLQGNHVKSISRIEKAINWLPQIIEEPVYSGILGLSLLKTGNKKKALPNLINSLEGFKNIKPKDNEHAEIYEQLKDEIQTAIQNNT